MPGLVGWGRARELFYLANVYDAQTMYRWGFLNKVFAKSETEHELAGLEAMLADVEPRALVAQKALMRASSKHSCTENSADADCRYGKRTALIERVLMQAWIILQTHLPTRRRARKFEQFEQQ